MYHMIVFTLSGKMFSNILIKYLGYLYLIKGMGKIMNALDIMSWSQKTLKYFNDQLKNKIQLIRIILKHMKHHTILKIENKWLNINICEEN